MIRRFLNFVFQLIRYSFIVSIFALLLMAGMATGGFFLLDYLIRGDQVEVPNLFLKSKAEAIEILNRHELLLNTNINYIDTDEYAPGIVIEQNKYPGTKVKKGRTITVSLSRSAGTLLVPELVGMRQDEIYSHLFATQMDVGLNSSVYSDSHSEGVIIAQYPQAGMRELSSKRINILTSLGPEKTSYLMPDLIGMYKQEAFDQVKKLPFMLEETDVTYQIVGDAYKWNRVMDQRPQPGSKVLAEERIKLTIGMSAGEVSSDPGSTVPESRMVLVRFRRPAAYTPGKVAIVIWDAHAKDIREPTIIPLQGNLPEIIERRIPVIGEATVMLQHLEDMNNFRAARTFQDVPPQVIREVN